MHKESKTLEELEKIILEMKNANETAQNDLDEQKVKIKKFQEKENLQKKNTLVPWDKCLLKLFKLINNGKELDPSMITYDDINGMVEKLAKNHELITDKIQIQTKNWIQQREKIRTLLQSILKNVSISGNFPVRARSASYR